MAIVQKILSYFKKNNFFLASFGSKNFKIHRFNPVIIFTFLILFSCLFLIISNVISKRHKEQSASFQEITKNNEFSNLINFLTSKIKSPYEEIDYLIENNDTVEKILKKFNVKAKDIKDISIKLKQKNLINIYSGRKVSIIIKKLDNKTNTLVSFVYQLITLQVYK